MDILHYIENIFSFFFKNLNYDIVHIEIRMYLLVVGCLAYNANSIFGEVFPAGWESNQLWTSAQLARGKIDRCNEVLVAVLLT